MPRTKNKEKKRGIGNTSSYPEGSRVFFPVLFSDGSRTRNPIRHPPLIVVVVGVVVVIIPVRRRLGLRVRILCGLYTVCNGLGTRATLFGRAHFRVPPVRPVV